MASTFSYAQAAKGIAAPAPTKKSAPSLDGPTKDGATTAAATSWAEDVETESQVDQPTAARESRPQTTSAAAPRESRSADSSTSSPDLGASSSSTVTKDDDVSSIPNTSSESTWDNKSQASTSVDKTAEPAEKTSEKVKKGKNAVVKPLQEALPPAVNPWKMRAEELKAKVSKAPLVNGATQTSPKKSERAPLEKASSGDGRVKGREDGSANRNNARDTDTRKSAKGRFSEKDAKTGSSALPPPPNRDQESWPTPETVIDEDRKKAQEKGDRADKDRKENVPSGKHEWVKVPYTPTVVFNTPLPNAANARRGGRPGGRGGAQSSGRPTGSGSNGAGSPEKDGSAAEGANPEHAKQDRPEGITQDGFSKERRVDSAGAQGINGHASGVNGDLISKSTQPSAAESDVQPRRASEASHAHGQNTTYPRQYPNRSGKGRRGDFSGVGERRRNGEILPAKDNTSDELRPSTGTQTDASGENDRHSSTFPEAHNGHSVKHGRYTSFSNGRERGRGGRGARGNYSNGHQYGNGHQSMHASTFSMGPQSPTTFNPGNNSFFPHSQGKYTRNGHRSQSVTTDAYRFPPYQNGTPGQMPPYNMYDYGMMQPMSPMPFPYGVDYHALVALITTQVEYYFSVDNLLKDMYLRRHMDSQGFVTLEFIAGFNRIKSLSTDLEIVKHVCQQSAVIEYRVGEDGQDRLRRRDGWAQWVLSMKERDVSAQNDGPKELHQPPVPHVVGFEQPNSAQWTPMPSAVPFDNVAYPQTNGDHVTNQDLPPVPTENGITNASEDGVSSTNAVSLEPDLFSDLQLARLTVVLHRHSKSQRPIAFTSLLRTFSNEIIDSSNGLSAESGGLSTCQSQSCGTARPSSISGTPNESPSATGVSV